MKQLSLQFAFRLLLFPSPKASFQALLGARVFLLWSVVCDSIYLKLSFMLLSQITLYILVRAIFLEQVSYFVAFAAFCQFKYSSFLLMLCSSQSFASTPLGTLHGKLSGANGSAANT